MTERRLKRGLALLLTLCLAIPLSSAFADEDDAEEMAAYWKIVGAAAPDSALTRAMNRDYAALSLEELKAVTADELLAFAQANQLPVAMARYAYYTALAELIAEVPAQTAAEQRIGLFLAMKTNPRDKAANADRREIRKALQLAQIQRYRAHPGHHIRLQCLQGIHPSGNCPDLVHLNITGKLPDKFSSHTGAGTGHDGNFHSKSPLLCNIFLLS